MEPLSPRNAEVARLRALARERRARHEAGRFIVEGPKLVTEVVAAGLEVLEIYVNPDWPMPADLDALIDFNDIEVTPVSARGIERISTTTSPQPVVAEVVLPEPNWAALDETASVLVALDLNDPGNVGTLARSAIASGLDAVICLGDTADPFSPKVIRSSAGSLFRVPVVIERDAASGLERLGALGIHRFGTRMVDATPCDEQDLTGPIALVLGSEAHGLGESHDDQIDSWLSVPMPGDTESLNVAMAGTILAYEVARQRRSSATS
jgi:TrmH family RNA methyltransferase